MAVQPQFYFWQTVVGPVEGPEEWPQDPPTEAARAMPSPEGSWHPVGSLVLTFDGEPCVLWARCYVVESRTALAHWKAARSGEAPEG